MYAGTVVSRIDSSGAAITALSIAPNGEWLLTGTVCTWFSFYSLVYALQDKGTLQMHNAQSGECIFNVDPMGEIKRLVESGLWSSDTDVSAYPIKSITVSPELPIAFAVSSDGVIR